MGMPPGMNPLQAAIMGNQGMPGTPMQGPEGSVMPAQAPSGNQNAAYVAPSITMPDTLAASLQNVNKHLILIARKLESFDLESATPQIETMMQLLQAVQDGAEEDGEEGQDAEPDS